MDKVLAKNGARHNMELLFSDVQTYTKKGLVQSLLGITQSFGIFAERGYDGKVVTADPAMKVTYTTPGSISVGSGNAITSEFHLINIPSTQTVAVSGVGLQTRTLYVKHKALESNYTGIINGFNYNAGQNLTATRETDSYEFVWDTNPGIGVSGLVLADVTSSGNVVTNIVDRRDENLFVFTKDALPGVVVRSDWTTDQSMLGKLSAPKLSAYGTASKYILFDTSSGANATVTVTPETMKSIADNWHVQNSDTYTTSSTFRLGGPSGPTVLTASGTANAPLYPHIIELYPDETIEYIDSSVTTPPYDLPIDVRSGKAITSVNAAVKLDISRNALATHVSSGVCTINVVATNDEYNNYHLYVKDINKDFVILDTATVSGVTTLTYRNINGTTPSEVLDVNESIYIHPAAGEYEIVAIPYQSSSLMYDQKRQWTFSSAFTDANGNKVTDYEGVIRLPIGQKYNLSVRSITQFSTSSYVPLVSGLYGGNIGANISKYVSTAYTHPYVAKFPAVTTGDANISLLPTYAGFKVVINPGTGGWTRATAYEIAWTNEQGGVNYATPNYQRIITTYTTYEISTPGRYTYNVKVRPMTGGQIVDNAISGSVVSGAGGAAPNDSVYTQLPVNFRTYQGVITYVYDQDVYYGTQPEPAYLVGLANIVTPAYSGITETSITVTNSGFTTDLNNWYNHYGAAAQRTETAWYNSSYSTMAANHVKMKEFPGSGAELAQGWIIPSGVSNVEITYDVAREYSGSGSFGLGVRVYVVPNSGPPVAGGRQIAGETYVGISGTVETKTIKAAIPAGTAGQYIWIEFASVGSGSYSNYYHIDNVTAKYKTNPATFAALSRDMLGEVIYDVGADKEYILSELIDMDREASYWLIKPVTGTTGLPTQGNQFRIGSTERARLVHIVRGFLIDYEITRVYFDCDVLNGRQCRIRWYQEGATGKAMADSLLVTASDNGFLQYSDVVLKEDIGARNLFVDLYDDGENPDNFSGITGTLIIFGRPYLQ